MKKELFKLLALTVTLAMALGMVPAMAEEAAAPAAPMAYIMYANADWSAQYWGADDGSGVVATNAMPEGPGSYTVALDFTGTAAGEADGIAFTALGIAGGENAFPNYFIRINAIRINGEAIDVGKGYTSSDDGVETRMNIFNEWVSELPADARSYDGYVDDANWVIVDPAAFAAVKTIEVDFDLMQYGEDVAYLMFADATWAKQYWHDGNEYAGVVATEATVTGPGDYSVGLDFTGTDTGKAEGVAFTALAIKHGENTLPGMYLKINDIRINGASIAYTKGYTSSDDGVETRMNIFNEWVGEIPADARSYDHILDGVAAVIVDKALLAEVMTYEVDFTLVPVTDTAYLMYANADWSVQYWGADDGSGVVATNAEITGPGTYTVGLDFSALAGGEFAGIAFTAVGITTGEKTFPGYYIDVTDIKINGESVALGKGYTSSDDQITTRENLFNEWVSELPADAHRADGDLEGAAAVIVDKDAFASVKTIEVTFDYIYGEPAAAAVAPLTEDEIAAIKAAEYNVYIGVQSENYIFRNNWDEVNYGRDNVDNPGFFDRLTGWDADNNAVDYGGTFADAVITSDGTYSVSLTTGDMGFASDTLFHLLFASTDIPSRAVVEGIIAISDVKVKIGDAATQDYTEITTTGDYAGISILDDYNQAAEPFGYTVPGANQTITITFTITGLTD